jgi:predicted outer membrane lipoprotein
MTTLQRAFQRVMKAAAEHDGERRAQRRNFFEPRGGGLGVGLAWHCGLTLADAAAIFNAMLLEPVVAMKAATAPMATLRRGLLFDKPIFPCEIFSIHAHLSGKM